MLKPEMELLRWLSSAAVSWVLLRSSSTRVKTIAWTVEWELICAGLHPTVIAESFQRAAHRSVEILEKMSTPVTLADRNSLLQAASTSLSSKIVSQYTNLLGPIAVDAVTRVINPAVADNVDLNDIRIVKKVGGTMDDTELVDGLVLTQNVLKGAGGPTRMEKAKIGFIQFQLSPPKPDVCPIGGD